MYKKPLIYVGIMAVLVVASILLISRLWHTTLAVRSPYVSELDSPVRGLSSREVDDLLNGRGAGYARTAELNSYPGPRHVLDLQ